MNMKRLIALALALVLSLALAACGGSGAAPSPSASAPAESSAAPAESAPAESASAESDLDYVKGKGALVIGYTVYAPMNYTDDNGEFTGFDPVPGDRLGNQGDRAGRQDHRLHLERHDPGP